MKAKLIILCGFPASGKSSAIHSIYPDAVVICPDDFRKVLTGQAFYAPAEEAVWSAVKTATRALLLRADRNVLIDATNLTIGRRAQWTSIAKETGIEVELCWVNTPFEICMVRNRNDGRDVVPDDVMERMQESFVEPTEEEGFTIKIHANWTPEELPPDEPAD